MIDKGKHIFETKMYLLSILPCFFLIEFEKLTEIYSFNKTIGWAYDITGISVFLLNFIISFFIGFCLLALFKVKTNWFLSTLFILSLLFCTIMQDGFKNIGLIDNGLIITILIYSILIIYSIFLRIRSFAINHKP
jgi:hypothetical protein